MLKSTYQSALTSIVFCFAINSIWATSCLLESARAWKSHFCSWSFDSDLALKNHSVIKAWKRLQWVGERKKNLKTIKHKPRLYLERSGCCIPIPDDLWDATEVPLKRERMHEQLFSVMAHTAYHDFPLQDWVRITTTPRQPAKLSSHGTHMT